MGLELNSIGMQQRRIAHMRFLGELYNYEQLNSSVIFDTLYLILFFGHGKAEVWSYWFIFLLFSCVIVLFIVVFGVCTVWHS